MSKRSTQLVILIFILFIGGFSVFNLLFPDKTFSPNENRELQTAPAFSLRALTSGRYTSAVETYCADQFALRDRWVALKARLELLQGKKPWLYVLCLSGAGISNYYISLMIGIYLVMYSAVFLFTEGYFSDIKKLMRRVGMFAAGSLLSIQ